MRESGGQENSGGLFTVKDSPFRLAEDTSPVALVVKNIDRSAEFLA